jgi:signal transduction histidine kinase
VPELLIVLVMVFIAVAVGAWPVANRLTRRLKQLRQGVERFGEGQLQHRVEVEGKDEVADVARSFNQAAQRIEELVTSHRSLLANASHELRSPLARMKMAIAMLDDVPPEHANRLKDEIQQDINELNGLVEEVLLASRLDARPTLDLQPVDVLGLLIEEAGRVGAEVDTEHLPPALAGTPLQADERLLRRAVRNLLENARRYGRTGTELAAVEARLRISATQRLEILIDDRGPGVPPDQRDRIFEPFCRMPGHAEHAGGVGLGLSLVAQIAQRHGGEVRCEAREGGGSRFVIALPMPAVPDGRGASRRGAQARK